MPESIESGRAVNPGSHSCLICRAEREFREAVKSFISEGFKRGEKIALFPASRSGGGPGALAGEEFRKKAGRAEKAFTILPAETAYIKNGRFEPGSLLEYLSGEIERALSEGFPALRVVIEISRALSASGTGEIIAYERELDLFLSDSPCSALCVYDGGFFSPDILLQALRAHPFTRSADGTSENLFYSPGESARGPFGAPGGKTRLTDFFSGPDDVLRRFVAGLPGVLYRCAPDADRTMAYISSEIRKISGYPPSDFTGNSVRSLAEIIHPEDRGTVEEIVADSIRRKKPYELAYRIISSDGSVKWLKENGRAVFGPEGGVFYLDGIIMDITHLKKAEEEKTSLIQRMNFILESAKTNINIIDSEYRVHYVDPAWEKLYGDYRGRKCHEYFAGRDGICPGCRIPDAIKTGKPAISRRTLPREGNRPVQITTIPFMDEEGRWLVAEVNTDISALEEPGGETGSSSFHDSLTGLYNRKFLEAEMENLDCEDNLPLGVVICRVDNLAEINRSRGMIIGGNLLLEAANLLRNSCRDDDTLARWSGDEFIIIIPYTSERRAQSFSQRLMKSASRIKAGGETLSLSTAFAVKGSSEESITGIIERAQDAFKGARGRELKK